MKKYPRSFKMYVAQLMAEGILAQDIAKQHDIDPNCCYRWFKEFKQKGSHAFPGRGKHPSSDLVKYSYKIQLLQTESTKLRIPTSVSLLIKIEY